MPNGRGSTPDDDAESTYCRQPVDMLGRASTGSRCAMSVVRADVAK
jgi:hypothetical protein